MDDSDPIENRTERLHTLRDDDPVAWAICYGRRGIGTISQFLDITPAQAQTELDRLLNNKEVRRVKFKRGYSYVPNSLELRRLAKRAWKLRQDQKRHEAEHAALGDGSGWPDEE